MSRRHFSVQTGARLHFGPLASGAEQGRRFGGIGMMIDRPGVSIRAIESVGEVIEGGQESTRHRLAKVCEKQRILESRTSPLHWKIEVAGDEHAGFGTGTQLSLAAASILRKQQTGDWPRARDIAPHLGRGARSAIGIYGFEAGGFLVDAGQSSSDSIGDLATRLDVPDSWRVVIVRRILPQPGLSGSAELSAFEELPAMSRSLTERLCRTVVMSILPAIQRDDCEEFAQCVAEYGREVGEYFSPVQSGVFSDPGIACLSKPIRDRLVQSSWGPTVVTFSASHFEAEEFSQRVTGELGPEWMCEIIAPRNQGAIRMETVGE